MSKNLREVYKGDFSKRKPQRYDDGGYVDYVSAGPSAQYLSYDPDTMQMTASANQGGLGNVTASDIAALTGSGSNGFGVDSTPTASGATATANLLTPSQLGESTGSSGSSGSGALSSILKALGLGGGSSSAAGVTALAGLLSAAGQYKQNASLMPKNNTAAASLANNTSGATSGVSSGSSGTGTQFGPSGGYNYSNYSGVPTGAAGLGYAPRTYTAPTIPNYYTYGQGPQASFFTPAAATPTAMKRGGHVSTPQRFDVGGAAFSGAPNTGMMPPRQGMPPQASGGAPTAAPAGMPPTANPTTGGSNPTGTPSFNGNTLPMQSRGQQQRPQMSSAAQAGQAAMHMPPMTRGGNIPQPVTAQPGSAVHPSTMPGMPPNMSSAQPTGSVTATSVPVTAPNTGTMPVRPMGMATGGGVPQVSAPQNMATVLQGMRKAGANSPRPYAEGGALASVSRHVKGPGDGTSDDIPARLANGEYVMDAQTVSMAGNGDNGAGAKALDKFRENIRKHKGSQLAKGKMAPDAKPLDSYMPKGQK